MTLIGELYCPQTTLVYKFKIPEVQINLHFGQFGLVKKLPTPNYGCIFYSDRRLEFRIIQDVRDIESRLYYIYVFVFLLYMVSHSNCSIYKQNIGWEYTYLKILK